MDKNGDRRILSRQSVGKKLEPMQTKQNLIQTCLLCAFLLIASSAPAQNLFVSDFYSGNIYEFTPGGVKSTFASGLDGPSGLAFNSAGDLFEADRSSGNIYEFTPGGVQSTFASGLDGPSGL